MRVRELVFGAAALTLVVVYVVLGSRVAPAFMPPSSPTPTPSKPVTRVPIPTGPSVNVTGTIAFAIRGDVYLLSGGGYVPLTSDGRSHQPSLSPDGRMVAFARIEEIDGKRPVDGQIVPAQLRFSNVVLKDSRGGSETVLINGLVKEANGFHEVTWFDTPALSPDGERVAVVADDGGGYSDLQLFDAQTGKRSALLSQGSNLADPSWSPDGKTIAVTSYTLGGPRILLVAADGRTSKQVKVSADGEPYRPSYSPDGGWLIYTLRHEGRNDLHAVQVAGGTRDIALTSDGKSWNGVFSPDGKQIAFLRERDGVIDMYSMDLSDALAGGSPKPAVKLTRGEGIDGASRPAWGS
ncbi:MAG TPA: LpqB family beta-propeller domain-containing protein [Candidatus Limnocylindria bacterium]|jgi:Tol biopolymer transport system component|nr:LpqB family beta-propeller domain-containing protein [Candidatus Limnocylindria bacterium]